MRDEEHAQTIAHLPALDQRLHTLGEVDDLLETSGADPEHLRHTTSAPPGYRVIIGTTAIGRKARGFLRTAERISSTLLEKLRRHLYYEGIDVIAAEVRRPDEILTCDIQVALWRLGIIRPAARGIEVRHDRSDDQLRQRAVQFETENFVLSIGDAI